jgi:hypothetical protein
MHRSMVRSITRQKMNLLIKVSMRTAFEMTSTEDTDSVKVFVLQLDPSQKEGPEGLIVIYPDPAIVTRFPGSKSF